MTGTDTGLLWHMSQAEECVALSASPRYDGLFDV